MKRILKKMTAVLLAILLLAGAAAAAEEVPTLESLTDLDETQAKLDRGVMITSVYYTEGYGFGTAEFTTQKPDEIARLWETVNAIKVVGKTEESITDWYPMIIFTLSDGSTCMVSFDGPWLEAGPHNYVISGDEAFRTLTAELIGKYSYDLPGEKATGGRRVPKVVPIAVDPDSMDLGNGTYDIQVVRPDMVLRWKSLTLALYVTDRYEADQITNLAPGDTLLVNGLFRTVTDVSHWEEPAPDGSRALIYEVATEEENWEGLTFVQSSDGTFRAYVGDWSPVTYVGTVTVPLPLPEGFVFYDYPGGDDPTAGTEEDLLNTLEDSSAEFFSPYNTTAVFRDGKLAEIHNWSYPWGPDTGEAMTEDA